MPKLKQSEYYGCFTTFLLWKITANTIMHAKRIETATLVLSPGFNRGTK